jgi:hypothetical protein
MALLYRLFDGVVHKLAKWCRVALPNLIGVQIIFACCAAPNPSHSQQ